MQCSIYWRKTNITGHLTECSVRWGLSDANKMLATMVATATAAYILKKHTNSQPQNTCRQHHTELWITVAWCLNFHTRINCALLSRTLTHAHILLLIYSYVRKCSRINDDHPYICCRTFDNSKHKLNLNLDFWLPPPHTLSLNVCENSVGGMGARLG